MVGCREVAVCKFSKERRESVLFLIERFRDGFQAVTYVATEYLCTVTSVESKLRDRQEKAAARKALCFLGLVSKMPRK